MKHKLTLNATTKRRCRAKKTTIQPLNKLVAIIFCLITFSSAYAQKPVIIGFGWDYPDVDQLSKKIDSMQNTPFDGLCISLQRNIMEAFDTVLQKDAYFRYDQLKTMNWGKYTDNFLILRGYSKTGGNWFDDIAWKSITGNMEGVSRAMLTGKLKGILFDAEYYNENKLYNPWTYNKMQYPNVSFEEVQNKVRERGKEFINALEKYTTNFSFLSIWLTSLVLEDKRANPLEGTRQALLIPFIEGVLLAKNKKVTIIDGNEFGYWYSKPSQFLESTDNLQKNTVELMRSNEGKQLATGIRVAQPVFYDGILARHASFDRGFATADKWRWLEENLKYAIATSNSNIVWFYYERVNWWKDKVNDTLINILQNCKQGFLPGEKRQAAPDKLIQSKCYNINTGKGYYYIYNPKKPMNTGDNAFTYSLDASNKLLKLRYSDKIPRSVSIFINNTLVASVIPKGAEDSIPLKNPTAGKVAILARYVDFEAAALNVR